MISPVREGSARPVPARWTHDPHNTEDLSVAVLRSTRVGRLGSPRTSGATARPPAALLLPTRSSGTMFTVAFAVPALQNSSLPAEIVTTDAEQCRDGPIEPPNGSVSAANLGPSAASHARRLQGLSARARTSQPCDRHLADPHSGTTGGTNLRSASPMERRGSPAGWATVWDRPRSEDTWPIR